MINRLFINKTRLLLVSLDQIKDGNAIYTVCIDQRPYTDYQSGKVLQESKTSFELNFTELVDANMIDFDSLVENVFKELNSRIAFLKLDMINKIRNR